MVAAPELAVVEEAEPESDLPARARRVARKAATFSAGYGLGWLVHTRLCRPSSTVEVGFVESPRGGP